MIQKLQVLVGLVLLLLGVSLVTYGVVQTTQQYSYGPGVTIRTQFYFGVLNAGDTQLNGPCGGSQTSEFGAVQVGDGCDFGPVFSTGPNTVVRWAPIDVSTTWQNVFEDLEIYLYPSSLSGGATQCPALCTKVVDSNIFIGWPAGFTERNLFTFTQYNFWIRYHVLDSPVFCGLSSCILTTSVFLEPS